VLSCGDLGGRQGVGLQSPLILTEQCVKKGRTKCVPTDFPL
jgi:hypothetical protein